MQVGYAAQPPSLTLRRTELQLQVVLLLQRVQAWQLRSMLQLQLQLLLEPLVLLQEQQPLILCMAQQERRQQQRWRQQQRQNKPQCALVQWLVAAAAAAAAAAALLSAALMQHLSDQALQPWCCLLPLLLHLPLQQLLHCLLLSCHQPSCLSC
jgi:lysylphosphatidylglycerol synthetase-like protein (DUF2156 family)